MAEISRARGGQGKKDVDVQELLRSLNLHEAELNEVVLGRDEIKAWPEVKWLAVAKVLTEKSFSLDSLKKTPHAAWTPAREVTFHAVEENLFVLQAHCLGDWNRIKYKKLPRFCDHCGRMGHTYLECGSGEYENAELQFGAWMVSEEQFWKPGTPGLRARTAAARESGGGRGRPVASRGGQTGRGTGMYGNGVGAREERKWRPKEAVNNQNKKRNCEDAGLDNNKPNDISDTATSPLKQTVVTESGQPEAGAKKMLVMDGVEDQVGERVPPPPPVYVPPAEKKKKMRKAATGGAAMDDEAGSGVERRQPQ
ncbi:hypothetical protein ACQ4PT_016083 [Festuca glaucescens]